MTGVPDTAEVVVVGGGIVGVSAAFFLAEAGVPGVVVLERSTTGSGATGRAAGIVMLQAGSEADLRLQIESIAVHRRLRDELGTDLYAHGSLLLWTTADEAQEARRRVSMHAAMGAPLELLDPDETRRRFPYLAIEDVAVATFSGADPWATPLATVQRLAEAARARGVVLCEDREVTGVEVDAGRVCRVLTRHGAISTPMVVNAAGAWARAVGEMAGVRVSVAPRKRQVFVLDAEGTLPPDAPFIEEEARDFYCKMRPEGLIMVCGQPPGETHDTTVEWGYLDDVLEPTLRRFPQLRRSRVTGAWAGIRPVSPDGQPVLGAAPETEGYVVAGGLGAQGFARGPLVGRLVAELITTGRTSLDVSPYRPDRFARARGR
ncbi:MAG TPA: FAD-binding oxidoreductase [bacterium]|nr:FAD-binding oxidoreductase [bacterium]